MSDKLSIEENIKNTFLNPMSFLYEEPINLLKQEVREPAIYTAIITAIATGHSRMSEISTKVGEDTNVCAGYLKNLINLGIVKKEMPYGETVSKKSIYAIEDNMFCFWYRFVMDNTSVIVRGAADLVYRKIAGQLSDYMGKAGYISDAQVVKRAAAAVKIELEKKKAMDIPIAVYDRKTQTIYEEKSDGSRKVVGERLRRGRYSERIAKKA